MSEILFISFLKQYAKKISLLSSKTPPFYYEQGKSFTHYLLVSQVQTPHSKTALEGYVIALSNSIAAVKDGKAAKGSLGVGAVKSLRTMLPKLDLLLEYINDSRILLTAAPGFGSAGDQRAPSALAYMS